MTTISNFMSTVRAFGVSLAVSLRTWVLLMSGSSGFQQFDSHSCRGFLMALHVRPSRCIMVEDKVASFDDRVAGKAGVVHRLAGGFAVVKLSKPPAAGRGVFS